MPSSSEIRTRLRIATQDAHERLHGHDGLAAVASGTIGLKLYSALLARLWGFHSAFEARMRAAALQFTFTSDLADRRRAEMLAVDLSALGWDRAAIAALPQCQTVLRPRDAGEAFGALYVIEGSTLGGVQLARALQSATAAHGVDARRFFLGYGERNGAMWRAFLAQLEDHAKALGAEASILRGANRTFADFEIWMRDWRAEPQDGRPDPLRSVVAVTQPSSPTELSGLR